MNKYLITIITIITILIIIIYNFLKFQSFTSTNNISGAECTGTDLNGLSTYDTNGQCTLAQCNTNYAINNGKCTKIENGALCEGIDPLGVYKYDSNGNCNITDCVKDYKKYGSLWISRKPMWS